MEFFDKSTNCSKNLYSPNQENNKKEYNLDLNFKAIKVYSKINKNKGDEKSNTIYLPLKTHINNNNNNFNKKIKWNYKYKINNNINNIISRNRRPIIIKNLNSIDNLNKYSNKNSCTKNLNLTENESMCLKHKNKKLRNIFANLNRNNLLSNNILFVETKKYLLMEEPRKKNEKFILSTSYNPNKIYTIFKKNNTHIHFDKKFPQSHPIYKKKNYNFQKNNTFNTERNKNKDIIDKNYKYFSKSLKAQRIKNIKFNSELSADIPKMKISKNIILNMHPINLRVFLK